MNRNAFDVPPPEQSSRTRCIGTLPRRGFLRMGFSAFGGLALADLLRLQSLAAAHPHAGASHLNRGSMQATSLFPKARTRRR